VWEVRIEKEGVVSLETMDFELVLFDQSNLGQPAANLGALVALQLENLPVLGMLHYSTIAREFLFACTDDFFQVIFRRESLNGGEGFSSVPLLDPDVD